MTEGSDQEEPIESFQYDTFISFANADREVVEALVAELEKDSLRCWIAPRDIRPGLEYGEEIINGIRSSRCLVVFLSPVSVASRHVRAEVERAVSLGHTVYPVRLADVEVGDALEFFLSIRQWVDVFDDPTGDALRKLAAAIKSDAPPEQVAKQIRAARPFNWFKPALVAGAALFTLLLAYNWVAGWLAARSLDTSTENMTAQIEEQIERLRNFEAPKNPELTLDDLELAGVQVYNGIKFAFSADNLNTIETDFLVKIGEEEAVPLMFGELLSMPSLTSLAVLKKDSRGRVEVERDMTSELEEAVVEAVVTRANFKSFFVRSNCDVGSCTFRASVGKGICSPAVSRLEMSQKGRDEWLEVDRAGCAGFDQYENVALCANFQMLPFEVEFDEPYQARLTFLNGHQVVEEIEQQSKVKSYGVKNYESDVKRWVDLEPIARKNPPGPAPKSVLFFQPADVVVGGFVIESGLDSCLPGVQPNKDSSISSNDGWLLDEDGRGLLRTGKQSGLHGIRYGPAHSARTNEEAAAQYRRMLEPDASIGIAVEHSDGTRVGPYWYTVNVRPPVLAAAKAAGRPSVVCTNKVFGSRYACDPEDKLPWMLVDSVSFGPSADELGETIEIDYGVDDFLLSSCDRRATECEPFRFMVPPDWDNVYFQIKPLDGNAHAIERIQIEALR